MSITVALVADAFQLLYTNLFSRDFRKSLRLHQMCERELLPLARTFLLGYFGRSLKPEYATAQPGAKTGMGRFDFMVGEVAVEFAVRRDSDPRPHCLGRGTSASARSC